MPKYISFTLNSGSVCGRGGAGGEGDDDAFKKDHLLQDLSPIYLWRRYRLFLTRVLRQLGPVRGHKGETLPRLGSRAHHGYRPGFFIFLFAQIFLIFIFYFFGLFFFLTKRLAHNTVRF